MSTAQKMARHEAFLSQLWNKEIFGIKGEGEELSLWDKVYRPECMSDWDHACNCHVEACGNDWRDLHHIEFAHAASRTKKVMGAFGTQPHKWPRYTDEQSEDFKNYGVIGERIQPRLEGDTLPGLPGSLDRLAYYAANIELCEELDLPPTATEEQILAAMEAAS